jgi:hypothetical protein
MNNVKWPTLAEIKESHAPKREYERYLLASRFIFRPLSFPATWLLVRLGVSGEAASWLSGLSALIGFSCLLLPGAPLLWPGIFFLLLFNFFDCLDGGIARIMSARNPYGRFLDSIMWWADMVFWTVIGVLIWRVPGLRLTGDSLGISPGTWLAAGALCAFLNDYAAYVENVFDQALRGEWEKIAAAEGALPSATPLQGKPWPEVFVRAFVHNMRVRETHYLLLALACLAGSADVLLAVILLLNTAVVLSLLIAYCRRGIRIRKAVLG